VECRGQDSHDERRRTVQQNRAAYDMRIGAEPSLPNGVAQDYCLTAVPGALLRIECPPELGLYADNVKKILRHPVPDQTLRAPVLAERIAAIIRKRKVSRQVCEGMVRCPQVAIVCDARCDSGEPGGWGHICYPYQAARIAKRQRPEQHGVHHTEDGRV